MIEQDETFGTEQTELCETPKPVVPPIIEKEK